MFYVVYLLDFGENIVIPYTWVNNPNETLQKFIRNAINPGQIHLCFYGDHENAVVMGEQIPNEDYKPNFFSALSCMYPCNEGLFHCNVIKYFSK